VAGPGKGAILADLLELAVGARHEKKVPDLFFYFSKINPAPFS
jgi:hypothetical protein